VVMRRVRFIAAQIGRKPGAGLALGRLLDSDDLPGDGWQQLDQRTWRTGQVENAAPWAQRARNAGSITAWRSFEAKQKQRWVWLQVTPFASTEDAATALHGLRDKMPANLRAQVQVVAEKEVTAPNVPGAAASYAVETHTAGPMGDGKTLLLAVVVGPALVAVYASGQAQPWDWPAVADIAARQAMRVVAAQSNQD
jgi:hypothetical protein